MTVSFSKNEYTAVSVGTEIHGWTHGGEPGNPVRFPRATGYCNVGTVLEVGKDVEGVRPGDRVAGQGNHASHCILYGGRAFYVKVPDSVSSRSAAFMVMGAIAIHGIRVARIELGEVVVVIGLGIVGQLAATLARLSGAPPGDRHRPGRLSPGYGPQPRYGVSASIPERWTTSGARWGNTASKTAPTS